MREGTEESSLGQQKLQEPPNTSLKSHVFTAIRIHNGEGVSMGLGGGGRCLHRWVGNATEKAGDGVFPD